VTITLIVTTDGRAEYLAQTLASIDRHLHGPITERIIWDDSGDLERLAGGGTVAGHRTRLKEAYGDRYEIAWPGEDRVGYMAAHAAMWERLAHADTPYVAQWEDDFLLTRDVDLADMVAILDQRPQLAQVALLRAPYYDVERQRPHDRILGVWPKAGFRERRAGTLRWMEHRYFFTCNPSVYRRGLCSIGWPQEDSSERILGNILARRRQHFAFLGHRGDPPALEHIGAYRAGDRY
jgi:hypothetical protein